MYDICKHLNNEMLLFIWLILKVYESSDITKKTIMAVAGNAYFCNECYLYNPHES